MEDKFIYDNLFELYQFLDTFSSDIPFDDEGPTDDRKVVYAASRLPKGSCHTRRGRASYILKYFN